MKLFSLSSLLFATVVLRPVFCKGHSAYDVTEDGNEYSVFTNGYERGRIAVTRVIIKKPKTLEIKTAYNGKDTTNSKLHLNQILMALWTEKGGLRASSLKRVKFLEVANDSVKAAIQAARQELELEDVDDFELDVEDADEDLLSNFRNSVFGKVVARLCEASGHTPESISIEHTAGWDDITWDLA
ncbi:uncharacterized protein CCOS01_16911 [Colletotrichum costaricense]|uniref:Uncharacterized protein n=1 Tax=Colletotrichum costaricense TaxID=1209916 RepID=A0AAI9YEU3_9PEZI|nr:uncharacterized protein CCOS01_16911 [Colletotrichum costaricense]KAK1504318.1 hypothetical protein CCOS01_16911 [Colletotrichum costaricense]